MLRLWEEVDLHYSPRGRDSKESIKEQMTADRDFFLGAFEDQQLVGVVIVSSDGRKGWINRLAVHLDYRRQGIATTLIAEAENILRRRDIHIFAALIVESNIVSKKLFKELGYEELKEVSYFSKRDHAGA